MGNNISDTFGGQRGLNSKPFQWALSALSPRMKEDVKIVGFSGRIEDWQKWKNRTSCTLVRSGYNIVLKKKSTAASNLQLNQVVYLQLTVATLGGTAYHLVKAHEKEKDEYEAWQLLLEWYDGDELENKTANLLRARLDDYCLSTSSGASHYINNFLTLYQELGNITNEGWSESHVLNVFLKGVTDPSYEMSVMIKRSKNESLDDA
eukprot:3380778-Ditylum_brightwellii.AAC.1